MPISVFGVEFSLTEILLGLIFIVLVIGLARLESRANLIIYELSDIRRDLDPLTDEAHERRRIETEREIDREFPNPLYEKMKGEKDED